MKLRAAAVSFLNARPLTAGLAGSPLIDLVLAEPSLLRRRCSRPATWTWRCSRWARCPGATTRSSRASAIGADGPVQTVVLAGEEPPDDLGRGLPRHRLAHLADPGPARARERGRRTRRYTPHAGRWRGWPGAVGPKGALVIGDRAFDVKKKEVLDLGREWNRLTGLPMVFAVWAARPGVLRPEDVQELARGAQVGLGMRTELAQQFARADGRRPGALPALPDPEDPLRPRAPRARRAWRPSSPAPPRPGSCPPTTLRFADDVVRSRRIRRAGLARHRARRRGPTASGSTPTRPRLLDEKAPLLELGLAADMRRRALHPDGVVTYIVSRNMNYTNVCTTACHFCAFYRPRGHGEAYVLDREELARKIEETLALGGIEILLQGGLHPDLGIEWYEDLFRWVKSTYPAINLHALSPEEIWHIARTSQLAARRHHRPAGGLRARLHPGRRRRDARRRGAPAHRPAQVLHRRVAHGDEGRPPEGAAEHRHPDVRGGRGGAPPGQPLPPAARAAGRDPGLHRLHLLDLPAGEHPARRRPTTAPTPTCASTRWPGWSSTTSPTSRPPG